MAVKKSAKCDPNGNKIAIFLQKVLKNRSVAGDFASRPPLPPAAIFCSSPPSLVKY